MKNLEDIANRLVDIVVSPQTIPGMINGALTVPLDFGYLGLGYLQTDSRFQHQTQRLRMADAIKNDVLNYENITNAVEKVLNKFDTYLSETQQNDAYRGVVTSMVGRMIGAKITAVVGAAVLARLSFIGATRSQNWIGRVTMVLLIGGMSERSIRRSEALAIENPEIYEALRPRNYDLTYFLFEPAVKPFVDAVHVGATQGQPSFDKIIHMAESKLNGA